MQYVLALIILRQEWGYQIFKWMGDRVQEFLSYADEGSIFVFGNNFRDHVFAFGVCYGLNINLCLSLTWFVIDLVFMKDSALIQLHIRLQQITHVLILHQQNGSEFRL